VVSHGCFLHFFTDDWEDSINSQATSWGQAEFRSFVFADDNGAIGIPSLVETAESRQRRGLTAVPLSETEQSVLRDATLRTWLEWGVISQ